MGRVEAEDHVLASQVDRNRGEVLGDGLAGAGQGVAVQESVVEEHLHDEAHAADAVEVLHHVAAGGLHVGEGRGGVVEVVELPRLERNLGLVGKRDEVEDGVGRAAEGHHRCGWRSRRPSGS